MPSPTTPSNPASLHVALDVRGAIPMLLSGRLVAIGDDGTVHSAHVHGSQVSYRVHRLRTNATVDSLVTFGSTILAVGEDSPAFELSPDISTLRRVDLAGHGRVLAACPKHDAATGELHLVARDTDDVQAHVVISAGALTRRSRPVLGTPSRITGLALSCDHTVFFADGFVGVAPRDGEARATWIATGVTAARPVHAHDAGDAVVLLALTPSLERWTLQPDAATIAREVLDETPRDFAHLGAVVEGAPRWLWTAGEEAIACHDLVDSRHAYQSLRPNVPGDFVVVPNVTQTDNTNGGWLVGFACNPTGTTDLRVTDAADITAPSVATARMPRPIPRGLRFTWIPLPIADHRLHHRQRRT